MGFDLAVTTAALLAGAVASVAGFGIGSILTPLFAASVDTRTAVAAVSVPHVVGTAVRFWRLRGQVDRRIFMWFGLASVAGGLTGALLHGYVSSRALAVVFGGLLLFSGLSELTGLMRRVRLGRTAAWLTGALSGLFGGLVGNQGGIRTAGLLAFDVEKTSFVATATAIGLLIDAARMPVYVLTESSDLLRIWPLIALATGGVVAGTIAGQELLGRLPPARFRPTVALLLLLLGGWMMLRG